MKKGCCENGYMQVISEVGAMLNAGSWHVPVTQPLPTGQHSSWGDPSTVA
jgi:hypothetical protein